MTWSTRIEPTEDRILPSGLRVILLHRPGSEFAVVLTQARGGSRADPVGTAGLAHLTEHLLTQGVSPDGRKWKERILGAGGDLAATTHPDYIEFCTQVPHPLLPLALQAERARLSSWPDLRPGELERQRSGVCREIDDHRTGRPTQDLPWPSLGPVVFGSWADGHDPFGETRHVAALTVADCRAFFEDYHRPERTVVVVITDLDQIHGGSSRVFAELEVPPSTDPTSTILDEAARPGGPGRTAARAGIHVHESWTAPHSVASAGWAVPSVVDDPDTHAALLAVAAQLARHAGGRARLGQMGPMDRAGGDVLTVTTLDPDDALPALQRAVQESRLRLEHVAADVDEAILRARTTVARWIDQPRATAQLLARAVTLAGDPSSAVRWVEAVRSLEPVDVIAAAHRLSTAEAGVLVGRPRRVPSRTRGRPSGPGIVQDPPSGAAPDEPVRTRTVAIERPTLTAAAVARTSVPLTSTDVRRLRSWGYTVTADVAGWTVELQRYASAIELAARVRRDLDGLAVGPGVPLRHAVLVGADASRAGWDSTLTATALSEGPEPQRGAQGRGLLALRPCADPADDFAHAELRWPVRSGGFVDRWAGVALLVGIHALDADGRVRPFDAPPGTFIGVRQEPTGSGPELVIDVWAPPLDLPDALHHLATELTPTRLERRCRHLPDVRTSLTAGWQRDCSDPGSYAGRAAAILDLGGTEEDIREFVPRMRATTAERVIDRIRLDTASAPSGGITTSHVDALSKAGLPWPFAATSER